MGTASASANPRRHTSAHVVTVHNHRFLVDCGEGCQMSLQQCGIAFSWIDNILISHLHGDHLFGLFPLLSTMGMQARTAPLNIYAPANFGPVLKFFLSYFGEGLAFEIRHIALDRKDPEVVYKTKSVEISAFPLDHKIDTYGFLFREKEPPFNVRKECIPEYGLSLTEIGTLKRGEDVVREDRTVIPVSEAAYKPYVPRSCAYCSDTASFPELSQWVKGVTLLYHEATYPEEFAEQARQRHHSTAAQAARCSSRASLLSVLPK